MNVAELLARPHAWMAGGESDPVVVSSRVRLARNLEEAAFPDWAGEEERVRVWERLRAALVPLPVLDGPVTAANEELSDLERALLFERHLVSREHAARGRGSGVMLRADESVAVMVNEEDHLRMQALGPGLDLQRTWQRINEVDDQVEGVVPYAFSPRLGYLTACPSNVGTGLRASVDAAPARPGADGRDGGGRPRGSTRSAWPCAGCGARAPRPTATCSRSPTR